MRTHIAWFMFVMGILFLGLDPGIALLLLLGAFFTACLR